MARPLSHASPLRCNAHGCFQQHGGRSSLSVAMAALPGTHQQHQCPPTGCGQQPQGRSVPKEGVTLPRGLVPLPTVLILP